VGLVVTNMIVSWTGLVLWYWISGGEDMDTSAAAVLVEIYRVAQDGNFHIVWPLLAFATLFLSGVITMVSNKSIY
jgi:hypothetical protein